MGKAIELIRTALTDATKFRKSCVKNGRIDDAREWLKVEQDYEQAITLLERAEENTPTSEEQLATPAVSKSEGIERKPTVCLTCKFNKPNNAICDFCNDNASKYSRQTVC